MSEELETQRQLAYIAALRDARLHRSAYFEKLALLNGGTVALVITAILGPMKGQVPHKHLLATALTILIIAMLLLLTRPPALYFNWDLSLFDEISGRWESSGRSEACEHFVALSVFQNRPILERSR